MDSLFLFFVAVGMGFLLVLSSIRLYHHKKRYHTVASQVEKLSVLLESAADAWCVWEKNSPDFLHQSYLCHLFGMGDLSRITLKDVLSRLSPADDQIPKDEISALVTQGKTVNFTAVVDDGHNHKGATLQISGFRVPSQRRVFYVLWFRDVSLDAQNSKERKRIIDVQGKDLVLFKKMFDFIPVPLWIKDEQQHIIYCNQTYADMWETTPEQILQDKKTINSWTKGSYGLSLTEQVLRSNATLTQNQHTVIRGERVLLRITEGPSHINDHLLGYALDETKIEKLEKEYQNILDSTRDVLERMALPIVVYNEKTLMEFYNQAYMQLWGLDATWLNTKPSMNEVLEELRSQRKLPEVLDFQTWKKDQLAKFTSLLKTEEESLYLPDGKTLRLVTAPYLQGGLMMMFNDVTDRLALERRYNTLMAVQRQTLENLTEGVIIFASDNRIIFSNSSFGGIWNIDVSKRDNLSTIGDFIDGIKSQLEPQKDWANYKLSVVNSMTDRSAKVGSFILKNKEKIGYKYTPLSDGSHLVAFFNGENTPQTVIAKTPKNKASPGPIMDMDMELMGDKALNMEPINLTVLINDICKQSATQAAAKNVSLDINMPQDIGFIYGDSLTIKKIFFNFIQNFIYYTSEWGYVSLTAELDVDKLFIKIQNSGALIPYEDIFNQHLNRKKKAGDAARIISLQGIKRIFAQHHGTISVVETGDNGTAVICELPKYIPPASGESVKA